MQLLRGDADLGAESELATVDESGRRVDEHGRRIDFGDEGAGRRLRSGHDRLAVRGAVLPDVRDGRVDRRDDGCCNVE